MPYTADMASSKWTLLSNHGHILVALSKDPALRIRDLVDSIGITERSVRAIISDLEEGGYLRIMKNGRRNEYQIIESANFRHPAEASYQVNLLLKIFKD